MGKLPYCPGCEHTVLLPDLSLHGHIIIALPTYMYISPNALNDKHYTGGRRVRRYPRL